MRRNEQDDMTPVSGRQAAGVPGVNRAEAIPGELLIQGDPMVGAFRMSGEDRLPIGEEEIAKAAEILAEYKRGKSMLENRVVEDEQWWELRHWEIMRRERPKGAPLRLWGRSLPPPGCSTPF